MQPEIDRIVEHTKDILARWDQDRERFNDPDPYFEEDGIVDVVATSEHSHTFEWVERCRYCDKPPSYYRRAERVDVKGELL